MEYCIKAVGLQKNKPPIMRENGGRVLPYHAVMYILKGNGYFQDTRTDHREVTPGTFFYLYPHQWHNFDPEPDTRWTEYWATFDGHAVERSFGTVFPTRGTCFHCGIEPEVVKAYETLYEQWFYRPEGNREYAHLQLHRILVTFHRHAENLVAEPGENVLSRARRLMSSRMDEQSLDFEAFARSENMSYESFRKTFRRRTGMPPHRYFLMLKMNHAREQLIRGNEPVKQIAAELGFDDPYYFSRIFRKKTGVSPARYRSEGR